MYLYESNNEKPRKNIKILAIMLNYIQLNFLYFILLNSSYT